MDFADMESFYFTIRRLAINEMARTINDSSPAS